MKVVLNMCFVLIPEKNLALIRLVVFEKNAKTTQFYSGKKKNITKTKARLLITCELLTG